MMSSIKDDVMSLLKIGTAITEEEITVLSPGCFESSLGIKGKIDVAEFIVKHEDHSFLLSETEAKWLADTIYKKIDYKKRLFEGLKALDCYNDEDISEDLRGWL